MDAADLDLEDLPPKALRKLIKSLLLKKGKPNDDKQAKEADDEREAIADLHASHKGKGPEVPVDEDDLPFDLDNESESDEESESDGPAKKDAQKPGNIKKRGK